MAIAIRLTNGMTLVPVELSPGESVNESATVHALRGFVVLEPGTSEFTVTGRETRKKDSVFKHFERIIASDDLPGIIGDEATMDELGKEWDNVRDFYRKVTEDTVSTETPSRTIRLTDVKVIDVDTDSVPSSATGWTPVPENMGVPAPLSAMVRGTLSGVPQLVADGIGGKGYRVNVASAYGQRDTAVITVEFQVPFSDARTKMVKKNPLSTRRDAKKVSVADTKYVELRTSVPAAITADTLEDAHTEVERFIEKIKDSLSDPVAVCSTCSGHGLVLTDGIRERNLR